MNRDSDEYPSGARRPSRSGPGGAQGASRGGFQPTDDERAGHTSQQGWSGRPGQHDAPFGGYPFGNENQGRQRRGPGSFFTGGPRFLGLPVNLIYTLGAMLIGIVFIGAVCGRPTATGSVAGQVKGLNADRTLVTLASATLTLRGNGQTLTTTSTEVPADAAGEAAYNYRFENVPRGSYSLSVTPPAGSTFQAEENITFDVQGGQLFPQSVMLLAQGMQKPRPLNANELNSGETAGYINERGERVVSHQGSGFDASDALLMYLLWRNPPMWGYSSPPVIISSPSNAPSSSYRVSDPPSSSRSGQTVTQQKPTTPGQGSTRPSGSTGVTGAGPNTSSGSSSSSRPSDAVAPSQGQPSTAPGSSGANTSTQPRTSTGTGSSSSGSQTTTRPSVPSQGSTRPSSSGSSPSRSSGSSGGGRR
ncbi:MAG: hypothetical protein IT306_18590 [Chloroflexi bacterium]|nr:hypothetical protein [Chloroflexota bacterium]